MLIVQHIEILWTKATRGAPGANRRAALPRAFAVEAVAHAYVVQRYRIAEWEDFVPALVETETKDAVPGSESVLRISCEPDGTFRLGLTGTPKMGQPKRRPVPDKLHLAPDQFVRLVVNARHTSYSGQHYSETIFNVACGKRIPSNRFLSGPPDDELDLKADLF